MSTTQVMQTMCENSSLVELYPTISKSACIALTIPVSTADVERGFSTMNRIKTEPRNRLNTETLGRLIRLSCEGLALMNSTIILQLKFGLQNQIEEPLIS